jgi:hypothetical protein
MKAASCPILFGDPLEVFAAPAIFLSSAGHFQFRDYLCIPVQSPLLQKQSVLPQK